MESFVMTHVVPFAAAFVAGVVVGWLYVTKVLGYVKKEAKALVGEVKSKL